MHLHYNIYCDYCQYMTCPTDPNPQSYQPCLLIASTYLRTLTQSESYNHIILSDSSSADENAYSVRGFVVRIPEKTYEFFKSLCKFRRSFGELDRDSMSFTVIGLGYIKLSFVRRLNTSKNSNFQDKLMIYLDQ